MSIQPPTATDQLHGQQPPPSSTTGNNLTGFTTLLPQTPSPMTPTNHTISNTNAIQTSTPESRLAASLSGIIFNMPSTSFQDAVATTKHSPLLRVLSDASVNQGPSTITTTTTPPKIPQNKPPRRDAMTTDDQQPRRTRKKTPLRRAISETTDHQPQKKMKTPPPQASPTPTGNGISESERWRKMEDVVREIEQRCREMLDEEEDVEIDDTHQPQSQVQEECVGVERDKNGDLKFDLSCSCGERFEILIKPNGYCFYKLT